MMVHKYFIQSDLDPAFKKYNVELTVVIPVHSLDSKTVGNESAPEAVRYAKDSFINYLKSLKKEFNGSEMKMEFIETTSVTEKSFIATKIRERGFDIIPFEAKN